MSSLSGTLLGTERCCPVNLMVSRDCERGKVSRMKDRSRLHEEVAVEMIKLGGPGRFSEAENGRARSLRGEGRNA